MNNKSDHNPIEILVKQNEVLTDVNTKLLNYYQKEFALFLDKTMDAKHNMEQLFEIEREKTKTEIRNTIEHLPDVELKLSDKDRKSLNDSEQRIKELIKLSYYIGGIFIFALIITLSSGYMAYKFYQTSVLSKSEVRGSIIQEINASGDILVDKAYHTALKNEKLMLSQFIEKNDKFKELYSTYRDGIVSNNKKTPFLKNLKDDNIINNGQE